MAHKRWLFTRGSVCRDLTGKIWGFQISARLLDEVPSERWSHMEVRLHYYKL